MSDYRRLGDYRVESFTLTSNTGTTVSLGNLFESMKYVEDVFNNYVYGTVVIQDQQDLFQSLPITGGETLEFVFRTAGDQPKVKKKFICYKVSSDPSIGSEYTGLNLSFCSKEALEDQQVVISKSFAGKQVHKIIPELFGELGSSKPLDIDKTLHNQNVVIPNWSPFQAINWFCGVSQPQKFRGCFYTFFENGDGFNFKTIESLYDQGPIGKYSASLTVTGEQSSQQQTKTIKSFSLINSSNDLLKSLSEGMYGSNVTSYDNVTKNYRTESYDYFGEFKTFKHLNKEPINHKNMPFTSSDQRKTFLTTRTFREESGYYSGELGSDSFSQRVESTSLNRSSLMSQAFSRVYSLSVYGESSLTCGKVITVELPNTSQAPKLKDSNLHRYYTENVLITKCVHSFSPNTYECNLQVVSDSMPVKIKDKYKK